jgi:hypothetical protein
MRNPIGNWIFGFLDKFSVPSLRWYLQRRFDMDIRGNTSVKFWLNNSYDESLYLQGDIVQPEYDIIGSIGKDGLNGAYDHTRDAFKSVKMLKNYVTFMFAAREIGGNTGKLVAQKVVGSNNKKVVDIFSDPKNRDELLRICCLGMLCVYTKKTRRDSTKDRMKKNNLGDRWELYDGFREEFRSGWLAAWSVWGPGAQHDAS